MSNNFAIRQANENDVPLILSFIKELAEYEKLSHEVIATEDSLLNTLFRNQPNAKVIIGEQDGEPLAFALYFYNYSTFLAKPGLYLEDLYVRAHARGNGIGQKMLSFLAYTAKQEGCGRFEWSVLDWNTDAIKFYHRLGAKPQDEWTVQRVTGEELEHLAATWSP
jgi:GNAT superfamily N-acetyltransferase